ncbi:uncharacterized protein LOC120213282 isoform X1 [Hibiscus syriacus]|uniref:uncharacterized protein LOC120213282 isoform X1 n=1 Tax=Hibiscus syriacus TaxID=106335 RepID=UPI001921A573|nr:uncharacterized protein LOC120213282 isoform X1 [Hibiscus syriacus]
MHLKGSGFVDSTKGCFENCFEKPDYRITEHSQRRYGHAGTSIGPRFHLESNNERSPPSRKTVILKPKPGETDTETEEKYKGFLGQGKGNSHVQVKQRKFSEGVNSKARGSVPSSGTDRKITRKTRDGLSDSSFEPPRLGVSRAQGLTKEPEFMMNEWYKPLCSGLDGSYGAQEAKQQILERWRMNKEFRQNGHAIRDRSRSRTLGEMLALPDHAKHANFRGPFGISSRDGWKNRGFGDLLKS